MHLYSNYLAIFVQAIKLKKQAIPLTFCPQNRQFHKLRSRRIYFGTTETSNRLRWLTLPSAFI